MPPDLAELLRWLEKADHDRRTAAALIELSQPITDTAAFHCQQAVEKTLKAFLFWHGIDFEKTHDLRALTLRCAEQDPAFAALESRVSPLTPYAVRFRYPGPEDPSVEEIKAALEVVEDARRFVLQRLPDEVRP